MVSYVFFFYKHTLTYGGHTHGCQIFHMEYVGYVGCPKSLRPLGLGGWELQVIRLRVGYVGYVASSSLFLASKVHSSSQSPREMGKSLEAADKVRRSEDLWVLRPEEVLGRQQVFRDDFSRNMGSRVVY